MGLFAVAVLLPSSAPAARRSTARGGGDASLTRTLSSYALRLDRLSRRTKVRVTIVHHVTGWAYGYVFVAEARNDEGASPPAPFVAQRSRHGWEVGIQGSSRFTSLLRRSPTSLLPRQERKMDLAATTQSGPLMGGSGPSAPSFSLPWATGETWDLWYGPHNTDNDYGPHPYTSLDFAGGDGLVHAAADGVAYTPCANLVIVDHGGGWETGYYHLIGIDVHDGERVTTNTVLGHIGTGRGCGGVAHGAHVHFSIYHFSQSGVTGAYDIFHLPTPDINGDIIGGWVVHDGATDGEGYMQRIRDGTKVYPTDFGGGGAIFDDGTVGAGGKVVINSGYNTLTAVDVYSGPSTSSSAIGQLANGAPVNIACQTRSSSSVGGSYIWDELTGAGYVPDHDVDTPDVGSFSPGLSQCSTTSGPTTTSTTATTTSTTGTQTTTTTPTSPPVNRRAVTSYDRIAPGAPYHGYFNNGWQGFTAASNTITYLGATVGNPTLPSGSTVSTHLTIKLCSTQPDANGDCAGQLASISPAIVNYGTTAGDIGDVAVTPGQEYWIVWYQPPEVNSTTWVTYWWSGGGSISQSADMEAIVQGYSR